ncbi:MAG: hypothetical protein RMA76_27225 [Deltaproteobacteria bacterium]
MNSFTAVASDLVGAAEDGLDASGDLLQHRVARLVAVGVVDLLEVVDVEQRDRGRVRRTCESRDGFVELLVDRASVHHLREAVLVRHLVQLGLRLAHRTLKREDATPDAQARKELTRIERLRDVVVRARLETDRDLLLLGHAGQQDHVEVFVVEVLANELAEVRAVHARHRPVRDDDRVVALLQLLPSFFTGRSHRDFVAVADEEEAELSPRDGVVVHDEDVEVVLSLVHGSPVVVGSAPAERT